MPISKVTVTVTVVCLISLSLVAHALSDTIDNLCNHGFTSRQVIDCKNSYYNVKVTLFGVTIVSVTMTMPQ